MLICDKSSYIYLVLFRVLFPDLKYRLLTGLAWVPKGRKKGDMLMRKKPFNFKANPDVVSRSNSNRYSAPQSCLVLAIVWFLISKLHGKHRASMWNNPKR